MERVLEKFLGRYTPYNHKLTGKYKENSLPLANKRCAFFLLKQENDGEPFFFGRREHILRISKQKSILTKSLAFGNMVKLCTGTINVLNCTGCVVLNVGDCLPLKALNL